MIRFDLSYMKAAAEPLDRWVGLYGPQPLYGYEVTTVFCTLFTPAIVVLLYFRNHPRYNIAGLLVASEPGGHTPLVRNHAHVREDTRPSSALRRVWRRDMIRTTRV